MRGVFLLRPILKREAHLPVAAHETIAFTRVRLARPPLRPRAEPWARALGVAELGHAEARNEAQFDERTRATPVCVYNLVYFQKHLKPKYAKPTKPTETDEILDKRVYKHTGP